MVSVTENTVTKNSGTLRELNMETEPFFSVSPRYTIAILKEGHHKEEGNGIILAGGNSTLIIGPHNVLVGTGSCQDRDLILRGLQEHNMSPENIEYVVCTHCHPETVGNLNLFPHATHVIGFNIVKEGRYLLHDFKEGIPYEIDEDLEVIASPGLSPNAVSVMVANSNLGTVAVAGSAFTCEEDLEDPDIWINGSLDPDTQQQSRIDILKAAQHIVPRYGRSFRVPDCYKGEMKVVMTP